MAFIDSYKPEETMKFEVSDGEHRVAILGAETRVSKKTHIQMICINLKVEGANVAYQYFVCEGEYFNKTMTRIFDAFKIPRGNFNFATWKGKITSAHFEHKDGTFIDEKGVERKTSDATLIYFHNNATAPETPELVKETAKAFNGSVQTTESSENSFPEDIPF